MFLNMNAKYDPKQFMWSVVIGNREITLDEVHDARLVGCTEIIDAIEFYGKLRSVDKTAEGFSIAFSQWLELGKEFKQLDDYLAGLGRPAVKRVPF